jgi:hypothetical protein
MSFVALADEKGAFFWKAFGMMNQGRLFAVTGKASDAVPMITSGFKLRSSNREKKICGLIPCHKLYESARSSQAPHLPAGCCRALA